MSIVTNGDVMGFFREMLGLAFEHQRVEASGPTREYLVGVLVGFAGQGPQLASLHRPLTFQLNEALTAPGPERFERLKGLGDSSLCLAGVFHDHLAARGVDERYVRSIGMTAYGSAASMLKNEGEKRIDLFGELSRRFESLSRVLHEVADTLFVMPGNGPEALVKLYERWRKTESPLLGRELLARGLVPGRGGAGVC